MSFETSMSPAMDDALTQAQKEKMRCQLSSDVEAFLAQGGAINKIADNVRADPPRKPSFNYGALPI